MNLFLLFLGCFASSVLSNRLSSFNACPNQRFSWHAQVTNFPAASISVSNVVSNGDGTYNCQIDFKANEALPLSSLTELKILSLGDAIFLWSYNLKVANISNAAEWSKIVTVAPRTVGQFNYCMPHFTIQYDWCGAGVLDMTDCNNHWSYQRSYDYITGCNNYDSSTGLSQNDAPDYCWIPTSSSTFSSSSSVLSITSKPDSSTLLIASSLTSSSAATSCFTLSNSFATSSSSSSLAIYSSSPSTSSLSYQFNFAPETSEMSQSSESSSAAISWSVSSSSSIIESSKPTGTKGVSSTSLAESASTDSTSYVTNRSSDTEATSTSASLSQFSADSGSFLTKNSRSVSGASSSTITSSSIVSTSVTESSGSSSVFTISYPGSPTGTNFSANSSSATDTNSSSSKPGTGTTSSFATSLSPVTQSKAGSKSNSKTESDLVFKSASFVASSSGAPMITKTSASTTFITITSCMHHACHEGFVPATWGPVMTTVESVETIYYTWCPEMTPTASLVEAVITDSYTTIYTTAECTKNACKMREKTAIVSSASNTSIPQLLSSNMSTPTDTEVQKSRFTTNYISVEESGFSPATCTAVVSSTNKNEQSIQYNIVTASTKSTVSYLATNTIAVAPDTSRTSVTIHSISTYVGGELISSISAFDGATKMGGSLLALAGLVLFHLL